MICGAYKVYGAVLFYCRYDLVSSGVGGTFFFCFDSFIYNPLHAVRRAMAAAVPLPLVGQRRAFIKKPSPTPNQLARL